MKLQGIEHLKLIFAAVAAGSVIAGCSAGGGQPTNTTTPPPPAAADLVVAVDKSSIADTGAETATITVTAVDANRNIVAAVPVTIVPDRNGVVVTSGSTTATGTGIVTGTLSIGGDKSNRTIDIVVTAGSITKTVKVDVTGAQLQAAAGAATAGQTAQIQYQLTDKNGAGIGNSPIVVTMNGTATNGTTDGGGLYTFTYTVPATATVSISAVAGGVTTDTSVTTSSATTSPATGTVTSASVAANPATVNVNTAGSTANFVTIRGLFLGAGNKPIQYVRVRFDLNDDPNGIGGTLAAGSGYVYTDANGVAQTTYTPGQRGSGNQQLTVRACWSEADFTAPACPNTATTNITVAQSGVSISIFNNGKINTDDNKAVYNSPYTVQVVDSVGQPIKGVLVTGSVDLPRYYRGYWDGSGARWAYVSLNVCDNEDINRNNVLESYTDSNGVVTAEDQNGSGKSEPYAADAAITPQSAGSDTTDAFGIAYFNLQYGQNVAWWDDFTLTFSAIVSGTEGKATTTGRLPIPASLVNAAPTNSLPFQTSPYNLTKPNVPPAQVAVFTVTDPSTHRSGALCQAQP